MRPPEIEQEASLRSLLDQLAATLSRPPERWHDWRIEPISGGANNLLIRATGDQADLALKFTIRDARDRAGREYHALRTLEEAGLDLGPRALLLDRERYAHPVVVQTWIAGPVIDAPPPDDAEWQALISHYAAIHRLTPARGAARLPDAVVSPRSIAEGLRHAQAQAARLPRHAQPESLRRLLAMAERTPFPGWPPPPISLCRCDPNILNFIRRPGGWRSVDWENCGWGDPAFEVADLMTHPAYLSVPEERWEWVIDLYSRLSGDPTASERIPTYRALMLTWWAACFARIHHEVTHGLPRRRRLAARNPAWDAAAGRRYALYLQRAEDSLSTF